MLILRNIGLRKGSHAGEKFDELAAGPWQERLANAFGTRRQEAIELFRHAHSSHLDQSRARTNLSELPEAHVKAHILFQMHSSMGFRNACDDDSIAELHEGLKSRPRYIDTTGRAEMLYGLDLFLQLCEKGAISNEFAFSFFRSLLVNRIISDPLFFQRAINLAARDGALEPGQFEFLGYAESLVKRYSSSYGGSQCFSDVLSEFENELLHARDFLRTGAPLDLGGNYVVYAIDGGIANRMWSTPEEIIERAAQRIVSILCYGIVPGGVVGGVITHDTIFMSESRPDIDLMNIYPESQAAIIVPLAHVMRAGFPTEAVRNAKVFHNSDRAVAHQMTVLAKETRELPVIGLEGPDPEASSADMKLQGANLVAAVPKSMLGRIVHKLYELECRIGLKENDLIGQIIPYDPALWGGVTPFLEFLQATEFGARELNAVDMESRRRYIHFRY